MKKRYTVIDNKTKNETEYTSISFNGAFLTVYLMGFITACIISSC